ADDGERAGGVSVDELHLHRGALAADQMLARMMEMELNQAEVSTIADLKHAGAGLAHVQLDGVAIVHDGVGVLLPGDLQWPELRLDGRADVDRRLLAADRASAIGGIKVAPLGRAVGARIAPVRVGGEAARRAERGEREPREQLQGLSSMHGVLPESVITRQ